MPTLDDDIDEIFSAGDFDVAAVFTLTSGKTLCARAFFTDGSVQVNVLSEQVEAVDPSLMCAASVADSVKRGNTATVNDVAYKVERVEKVGNGSALVYLKTR